MMVENNRDFIRELIEHNGDVRALINLGTSKTSDLLGHPPAPFQRPSRISRKHSRTVNEVGIELNFVVNDRYSLTLIRNQIVSTHLCRVWRGCLHLWR